MSAGGMTVGIYTTNSDEEVGYILGHSKSAFFVVENEEQLDKALSVRSNLPDLQRIIVMDMEGLRKFKDPMVMSFDELRALGREADEKDPERFSSTLNSLDPDDVALLIYTSGTTGPPKGAMLTHRNILWTAETLEKVLKVYETDELVSFLPLSHIAERMFSVFLPLRYKYIVNFIENTDTVTQNVVEVHPTIFFAVPRIWEKYYSTIFIKMQDATLFKRLMFGLSMKIGANYADVKLSRKRIPLGTRVGFALAHFLLFRKLKKRLGFEKVRLAISGAAPISPDVLKFYHAIGIPVREVYGQTEGCGPTSIHRGNDIKVGTVGPPLPGVDVKLAEDGEILFRGGNVFKGYYRNPEATASTLVDGWLHSGDVGKWDEEGFLMITDRKKDLIITSGGKNIAPQNIENQLKFSPYINDAVVIGDARKYLTALIIIDEDNVVKYATENKIQYTTYATLTQTPQVIKLIQQEVDSVNKTVARVEQIKKFRILPKKLLQEDGEVTPTMKVKRRYVNETFKDLIESMY
jgi:long-chain acyl-CoA synthetase